MGLVESSSAEQFGYRRVTRGSYEPQQRICAVPSLLARLGIVRLLYKLSPAPHDLPQKQRADRCTRPLDAASGYHH